MRESRRLAQKHEVPTPSASSPAGIDKLMQTCFGNVSTSSSGRTEFTYTLRASIWTSGPVIILQLLVALDSECVSFGLVSSIGGNRKCLAYLMYWSEIDFE